MHCSTIPGKTQERISILVQQEWKEDKKENKSEEYIRHKHGQADFRKRFEGMVELRNNK